MCSTFHPSRYASMLQHNYSFKKVIFHLCSRPAALIDRTRDSDEEDVHDRDYDVAALANNISQAFQYSIYGSDDAEVNVKPSLLPLVMSMGNTLYHRDILIFILFSV